MMPVTLKRAYDARQARDGYRVLVDRLWPRSLKKEEAAIDDWLKEIEPSDEFRKRFALEAKRWGKFRHRHLAELKQHRDMQRKLAERAKREGNTCLRSQGYRDKSSSRSRAISDNIRRLTIEHLS